MEAGARIRVSPEGERVRIRTRVGMDVKPAPGFEPGTPSLRVKCSGQLSYAGRAHQFRGRICRLTRNIDGVRGAIAPLTPSLIRAQRPPNARRPDRAAGRRPYAPSSASR